MPADSKRLLILSANLQEAFRAADVRRDEDLVNFATRVETVLDRPPDVVLLQEVVLHSATRVAELLTETSGQAYIVAVSPAETAVRGGPGDAQLVRDTAVLINSTTMEAADAGGIVTSRYERRDGAPGEPFRVHEQTYAQARARVGALTATVASVHFVTSNRLSSREVAFGYKARWSAEVADALESTYPDSTVYVIGGDFNNRRCTTVQESVGCDPTPFWSTLADRGYDDSVFTVHGADDTSLRLQYRKGRRAARRRIDYIFVKGQVIDSSHDVTYGAREGEPGFYSDHRFLWAVAAAPEEQSDRFAAFIDWLVRQIRRIF